MSELKKRVPCSSAIMLGLLLIASIGFGGETEQKRFPIQPLHRVMCITQGLSLEAEHTHRRYDVTFGELFRVEEIEEDACLVSNSRYEAWMPHRHLVDLGDAGLLPLLQGVEISDANREFAIGSYYTRRDVSKATQHFKNVRNSTEEHATATFALLEVYLKLNDQTNVRRCTSQLKKHPQFEEIVLASEFSSNSASDSIIQRCEEVARDSPFLSAAMAQQLWEIREVNKNVLAAADRFANHAIRMLPHNASHRLLLARIRVVASRHLDDKAAIDVISGAFDLVDSAVTCSPDDWRPWFMRAQMLADTDYSGRAIQDALQSLRLNPRAEAAASMLADFMRRIKDGEEFTDANGRVVDIAELAAFPATAQGLALISDLDIPQIRLHPRLQHLRLHGEAPVPRGSQTNEQGLTALHLLTVSRNYLAVDCVTQISPVDWSVQTPDGYTPLQMAVMLHETPIVSFMIDANADPGFRTDKVISPIDVADDLGHEDILFLFSEAGNLSNETKARLNQIAGLPAAATDELRRKRMKQRLYEYFDRRIDGSLKKVLVQRAKYRQQLAKVQTELDTKQQPLYYARDNSPVMFPEGYDADMISNPVRARLRFYRLMQDQVDETLRLQDRQLNELSADKEAASQRLEQLTTSARNIAWTIVGHAMFTLNDNEFEQFRIKQGKRMSELFAAEGIKWTPQRRG